MGWLSDPKLTQNPALCKGGRAGAGGGSSLALGVPAALAQPQHQTTSLASPALQSGLMPRL